MSGALLAAPVRMLTTDDLPACLELAGEQGWLPEVDKWRLLLELGVGFGVQDPGSGRLVATVIVTDYQQRLAVVGMLLVSPAHGRQGLGTRLMRYVLHHMALSNVVLYATEAGEPLYRKLGFQTVDTVIKHHGRYRPTTEQDQRIRPLQQADLAAIIDLDHSAFGARRDRVVTRMLAAAEHSYLAEDDHRLRGYAAAWRNLDTLVIGPVIADNDHTATSLIDTLARQSTVAVSLDLPASTTTLSATLSNHGLQPQPPAPVMTIGGQPLPGLRRYLYSPIMQALG